MGCWIRINLRRHFGLCQSLTSLTTPPLFLFRSLPAICRICKKKNKLYFLLSSSSSLYLPVSHSHPVLFCVHLSSLAVYVLLPDCPHCPLTLSTLPKILHSRSYSNQPATMLENIIMLVQKEISSPSRELCCRIVMPLSNFHML